MVIVKSLETTPTKTLYQAFKSAFSDYIESFDATEEQFEYMLARRGFTAEMSFGAFIGETLVGFTLNAVGQWQNKPTAYDTGTGTIVGFRQQGIATRIFNEMIPVLRKKKITQYLLEVIKTNHAAYNIYKNAGFKITREFNYYITDKKDVKFRTKLVNNYSFRIIDKPDWDYLSGFRDFDPSWQNSVDSINRKKEKISVIGIFIDNTLVGYGALEKHSGDIMHLAIAREYRRRGLATLLLKHLCSLVEVNNITIINTLANYQPFNRLMESTGIGPRPGQYEMLLEL